MRCLRPWQKEIVHQALRPILHRKGKKIIGTNTVYNLLTYLSLNRLTNPSLLQDALKQISTIYESSTSNLHNSPTPQQKCVVTSSFVRGPSAESEDPFTSTSNRSFTEGVSLVNAICTPSRRTQSANVTPNHRVVRGDLLHTTPTGSGRRSTKLANITLVETAHTPREDRRKQTPCAENAQGLYSTEASVFVAK